MTYFKLLINIIKCIYFITLYILTQKNFILLLIILQFIFIFLIFYIIYQNRIFIKNYIYINRYKIIVRLFLIFLYKFVFINYGLLSLILSQETYNYKKIICFTVISGIVFGGIYYYYNKNNNKNFTNPNPNTNLNLNKDIDGNSTNLGLSNTNLKISQNLPVKIDNLPSTDSNLIVHTSGGSLLNSNYRDLKKYHKKKKVLEESKNFSESKVEELDFFYFDSKFNFNKKICYNNILDILIKRDLKLLNLKDNELKQLSKIKYYIQTYKEPTVVSFKEYEKIYMDTFSTLLIFVKKIQLRDVVKIVSDLAIENSDDIISIVAGFPLSLSTIFLITTVVNKCIQIFKLTLPLNMFEYTAVPYLDRLYTYLVLLFNTLQVHVKKLCYDTYREQYYDLKKKYETENVRFILKVPEPLNYDSYEKTMDILCIPSAIPVEPVDRSKKYVRYKITCEDRFAETIMYKKIYRRIFGPKCKF